LQVQSSGITINRINQAEIARTLNISEPTVSRDVKSLKDQGQKELETHIQERLPFEYASAMTGINNVLKRTSEILDQATDTKVKLEAMKLLMDLYKPVMSMAHDGGIIEQAMKRVKGLEREDISKVKMSPDEHEEDFEDEEITVNNDDEIPGEEEEDLREEQ
jgi:DNA-binding Lrp family transcriptional regulator